MQDHPSRLQSRSRLTGLARPLCLAAILLAAGASASQAAVCTPTGFVRDGINLTAAEINPSDTVSGDVDATGCNIGIYFGPRSRGSVQFANIHGADYFGIANNGGNVSIDNSSISNISDSPLDGNQHGNAIYFAYDNPSRGEIQGNYIWSYQKGGIVINGQYTSAEVSNNTVVGLGPTGIIAQNGIQVGYGATARIEQNFVYGNSYTGAGAASGGILLVGGPCFSSGSFTSQYTDNVQVSGNIGTGNDVGVWFVNLDSNCNTPSTPTRDAAAANVLVNNAVTNPTYQAGISDTGDDDVIASNTICGSGYAANPIDTSGSNNPIVEGNNTTCSAPQHGHGHDDALAALAHHSLATTPPGKLASPYQ